MEMAKCVVIIFISSICCIYSLDKLIDGFAIRAVPRDDVPPSLVSIILHVVTIGVCMSIDVATINTLIHLIAR